MDLVTDYNLASTRRKFLGHSGVATIKSRDFLAKVGNKYYDHVWSIETILDPVIISLLLLFLIVSNFRGIGAVGSLIYKSKTFQGKVFRRSMTFAGLFIIVWRIMCYQLGWIKNVINVPLPDHFRLLKSVHPIKVRRPDFRLL